MIRNHKRDLILSSLLILSPVLIGILLWERLPQEMPIHWGLDGTVDGWSSRAVVVFGMPMLLLTLHWLCIFVTMRDPKNGNQNEKVFRMVLWIVPLVMLFTSSMIYLSALGATQVNGVKPVLLFLGVLFLLVGNYLPKCRQNSTIGIKIKWTMENEENWNVTHRMAGRLWVVGGLLLVVCVWLPIKNIAIVPVGLVFGLVIVPVLFSWKYHKKQKMNKDS